MKDVAALISSIAALISAVAWPAAIVLIFAIFRPQFRVAIDRLPSLLDRMQKLKLGMLEAELNKSADPAADKPNDNGEITLQQISSAAVIKIQSKSFDIQTLRDQLQVLCIEYETTRNIMAPGMERTRAMTQVVNKMRALGPSVSIFLDELKQSDTAGNRLTAIAIMQMEPKRADISWLLDRFRSEVPFIFFHAAIALEKAAQISVAGAIDAAHEAANIVSAFAGTPDRNTLVVLDRIKQNADLNIILPA